MLKRGAIWKNKQAKTKIFLAIILVVIFSLSLVYAFASKSIFLNDSSQIHLLKQYTSHPENFHPMEVHDYLDEEENSYYKVQIINFENPEKLDSWMRLNMGKSSGNKMIDGKFIFIDENKNFIFWREGKTNLIQIIYIGPNDGIKKTVSYDFRKEGEGIFSEVLINEVLKNHPSNCDESTCLSKKGKDSKSVWEDLKWFANPPDDLKNSDTDERYESISEEDDYELKNCGEEIDYYLNAQGFYTYDDEQTFDECLLRERFLEDNKDYNQEVLDLLLEERNKRFVRDLEDQYELKANYPQGQNTLRTYKNGTVIELAKDASIKMKERPEDLLYWFER